MESYRFPPIDISSIRVLSLAQALAGNVTAQILAELGADVVKVESLSRPDGNRRLLHPDHDRVYEPSGVEVSTLFAAQTRSQRGIGLDITNPDGRSVFDRLLSVADVLLYNISPAAAERLGLNWERVVATKPDLILLAISGYGATGPNRHYLAYGGNISAAGGLTSTWGFNHGAHHDYVASYHGVLAVMVALINRAQTGTGAFLDLAQTEAGAAIMGPVFLAARAGSSVEMDSHRMIPWAAFSAVLRCKGDDAWLALEAGTEQEWRNMCTAMGRADLPDDPALSSPELRADHHDKIRQALEPWTRSRTPYQACRYLQARSISAGVVQNSEDLYRDPQLWSQGYIRTVVHPEFGPIVHAGPSVHITNPAMRVSGPAPRLGQHTREVLRDWLDYPDGQVDDLDETDVVYDLDSRRDP